MGQKTKRNYGKMTAAVNLVKSENSGVFGVKDIRSAFKQLGVPMYSEFATTLVQQGTWVEQPKETTEIEQVLEEVPVHEHKELVPVDKAINKAIKLLTENGYRVSKPVLIYEEVTVK